MNTETLTPEYIASVAKDLTEQELIELIGNYGFQEVEAALKYSERG